MIISVEAMTSACQVWDREKKMLTVAQTIGTNQIPLPTQVSEFPTTVDAPFDGVAMLIPGTAG